LAHCIIQNTNITIIEIKKISLKYNKDVCIIQEEYTANGMKLTGLKTNIYLKKLRPVIVNFIKYYCLFIN